ncbi:Hypothetical protein A7982_08506 [Minicystis rosea]|nr:Hypothetical protein A7982_08506 [Minicystis rosea]
MPTMACQRVRSVILLIHGADTPTQPEWDEYLKLVEDSRGLVTQVLVDSAGGAPTPTMRAEVQKRYNTYKPSAPPVAVLSNSMIARGIVTAISWGYGRDKIRAFAPGELDAALDWLKLDRVFANDVRKTIPVLKSKLG